jgi:ribonuclease HII
LGAFVQGDDGVLQSGDCLIVGVDEAGRGPLAGPVFAAAVVLGNLEPLVHLNDSKKISPKKRSALSVLIKEHAVCWSIASASVAEIDALNILQATFLAMRRAVHGLPKGAYTVLIDGNQQPAGITHPCRTIVGGDACEPSIMAASILAKVARDEIMIALATQYPGYGFERHKGYGTRQHMAALHELGPITDVHRDFEPVRSIRDSQTIAD